MPNATDEGDRTPDRGERPPAGDDGPGDAGTEERFGERLSAVERAVTGSDAAVADLGDGAAAAAEREAIESRVAELESRVEELEAATQAVRGYVGSIRAVNREVERRADLALARASRGTDAASDAELPDGTAPDEAVSDSAGPTKTVPGDEIPSETALDAAVPADDARPADPPATAEWDAAEGGEDGDGSWRDEALERLRESL
jgi:hypothetical protein